MSEVANQPPKPKDASSTKDTQAHPVREWIDTLLKAAVIAKGDQKTGTQPQTEDTSPSATAATETTATSVPTSNSSKDDDAENKPEKTVDGSKETAPPPPSEGLEDGAVDTGRDATEASTTVAKRYRRRRCEVEGCNKFARFNNACSGHGGRRLCAENGCERVAQFGHKCSAHGGVKYCSVEGCKRAVQSRGCCKTHGGGVRCQHPDCTKGAISKGLCRAHGGGSRCAEQGCQKWAQRHGYCVRHSKASTVGKVASNDPVLEPGVAPVVELVEEQQANQATELAS